MGMTADRGALMKIVYCSWKENIQENTHACLKVLSPDMVFIEGQVNRYLDYSIYEELSEKIPEDADVVFSWDFMRVISDVCHQKNIPYAAYVWDWPNDDLYNQSVYHPCNHIFVFDREGVSALKERGVLNVEHLTLGVPTEKYEVYHRLKGYEYDVSFVGNLYQNLSEILPVNQMPQYAVGFVEALCQAQQKVYGYNLVNEVITEAFMKEACVIFPDFDCPGNIPFAKRVNVAVTGMERRKLLRRAGEIKKVDLFTAKAAEEIPNVEIHGAVSYDMEMPYIFRKSRINLNITLRSITSGIPLRVLDIMGVGGFCLTNYQPEIAECFENGRELAMYESEEDFVEKLRYYLENEDEREWVAQNGFEKVQHSFSLAERIRTCISKSLSV